MKTALDHIRSDYELYLRLRGQRDALNQQIKELEDRIREEIGNGDEATINGNTVFTYRATETLRLKQLQEDNPALFRQFTRQVVKQEFDLEAFKQAHPTLYGMYQSRSLRLDPKEKRQAGIA